MANLDQIIKEIDAYCAKAGISPSTLCRHARNNPRLYDRLKARAERIEEDVSAIRAWMKQNPIEEAANGPQNETG
jgi:hypothetical protein